MSEKTIKLKTTQINDFKHFHALCKTMLNNKGEDEQINNEIIDKLRVEVLSKGKRIHPKEEISSDLYKSILIDLIAQGWKLQLSEDNTLSLYLNSVDSKNPQEMKDQVRRVHLLERDSQLHQKSVEQFIKRMEQRKLTDTGWHSIFSLMRDGKDLADKLRAITFINNEGEKLQELSKIVKPYIQFVEPKVKCEHTGFVLNDIWRYFRHTWVNSYKSIPGRSIQILIRDAAVPNHPVIGIAALGSSIVQQSVRDEWIGWDNKTFIKNLSMHNDNSRLTEWLLFYLHKMIEDIYIKDLLEEGFLNRGELENPTQEVINNLKEESQRAIQQHRRFPKVANHKSQLISNKIKEVDWEIQSRTSLFRSKRCTKLASLLSIKKILLEAGIAKGRSQDLQKAIRSSVVKSAIGQIIRQVKAEHVGIDMMDITVCGAVAPYNAILGGKLVCLLICSSEVIRYHNEKYSNYESIIASSMKGSPVYRHPKLVFLGTTSLYSVGSSQYNRIKVPANEIGVKGDQKLEYKKLGFSEGFGSYHFSKTTLELIKIFLARNDDGRRVNSIFGEGVNPLLRKIRQALNILGLPGEIILKHGNRRIVYGVALASNFREVLFGFEKNPAYLIQDENAEESTEKLIDYWLKRWLQNRIKNSRILEEVGKHDLSFPIKHGARVNLLKDTENMIDFWKET